MGRANPHPRASARAPEETSEAAASPRDDFYRMLVESVRDYAIFALDPTGHVASWNPGAERLKGYHANDILGRHFGIFYPDEDVARGKPDAELRIAAEQGRYAEEGWRERKDGTRFWAGIALTAMRDPVTRELIGFAKVTRDLSERRMAEETLRRSEERFRLMVEQVHDYAIFALDADGIVKSWNVGAQRVKGYRPKEIVGKPYATFFRSEDQDAGVPDDLLGRAAAEGHVETEGWRVRKDGTPFWASVALTALRDGDGRLVGYSKVTRDLTERRKAEQALREAYAQSERRVAERTRALQEANSELEAFAYSVSHDLRAPLRGIDVLARAALDDHADEVNEELRDMLERIGNEASRVSHLVGMLLSFSRVGREEVKRERVDLAALAEDVARDVRKHEPERDVRFDVRPAPEAADAAGGYVVHADEALVRLALENILMNAWKYTRKQPHPHVEMGVDVTPSADGAPERVFFVRDNGAGFDPERADRLFVPFNRLHESKEFEGTGIGLSSVKRVVERHGGRVWAEGRPGDGATFYFTLPATTSSRAETE